MTKLNDGRSTRTGVMCSEVVAAILSMSSLARTELALPPDLGERVKCVARRSAVCNAEGLEIKGAIDAVEAINSHGTLVSAGELSTYKGDFGLKKKSNE